MTDRRRNPRFPFKLDNALGVTAEIVIQNFESHVPIQQRIGGTKDTTHPALADLLNQLKVVKSRPHPHRTLTVGTLDFFKRLKIRDVHQLLA